MPSSPLLLLAAVVVAACSGSTGPAVVCSSAATTPASGLLYVANIGNRITVYSAGDTGNAAPTATIAGSNTGLTFPWGITRDTAGRLYVVNLGTSAASAETVTVYAANAFGNVAPIRTIGGSKTALHHVEGIAVDAAGQIYVANLRDAGTHGDSITVFAANASGNVAPVATIAGSHTGLNAPWSIALAADGRLFVANNGSNSIAIFAPGASGNVAPIATIGGGNTGLHNPQSIALDDVGQLYVENDLIVSNVQHVTITVYAPGAFGNVVPTRTIGGNAGLSGAPVSLAVDHACRLYVANEGSSSITVYASDATGNAAPITSIAGSNTELSGPAHLTF